MESGITLSISLLVSNRRDTIEKCMESLRPLTEAVPCEIIAVDTGSTDGSIEVVRKYTDKIISFPWCNDFSAARNTGLQQAVGEWFLYLDDDEWFESTQEIIAFLMSEESKHYQRLCYKVRNYRDFENPLNYEETLAARMSIRTESLHFEGLVHETMMPCYGKEKQVNDFVHHYGYVFNNQEDKKKHNERNIFLLEESLKRDAEDIQSLMQLVLEYMSEERLEEAEKVIDKGIKVCKDKGNAMRLGWLLVWKGRLYAKKGDIEELKRYAVSCEKENSMNELAKANLYKEMAVALFHAGDNRPGIAYGKQYLKLVNRLRKNVKKIEEQSIASMAQVVELISYTEIQILCIEMNIRERQWYEAWQLIEKIDWKSQVSNLVTIFGRIFVVADKAHMFGQLKRVINELLESDEMEKHLAWFTEKAKHDLPEREEEITDLFAGIKKETAYVLSQKFASALRHGEKQDGEIYLKRYAAFPPEKQLYYIDFIWQALEYGFPIRDFIESLEFGRWEETARVLKGETALEGIPGLIEKLEREMERDNKKFLYARMILLGKGTEEKDGYFEYLTMFLPARLDYLQSLEPDDETKAKIEAAELVKDGIHEFRNREFSETKKRIMNAIKLDKQLEPNVVVFLEKILEELQVMKGCETVKSNPEFEHMAEQLKGNVRKLLSEGKKEEAQEIVRVLQGMIPEDKELERMYREG